MAAKENHETEGARAPDWCNEHIFQRNRLPARSYFLPDTSLLLNGVWDFHYAATPLEAPSPTDRLSYKNRATSRETLEEDIEISEHVSNDEWQSLQVPSHWQLEGFGRPQYTNIVYPFPVCPPFVPSANPTGTYRRQFQIPKDWASDSQLRLRFDGVDSAFHLWVNGEQVGYSQGSRNAAEFDVSKYVRRNGQNDVFVRVYQWCDGSYIEDQDQWWLSGIFRDVYLLAFPSSRVEDFFVKTELDDEYEHAELQLKLNVHLEEVCEASIILRHKSVMVASRTLSIEPNTTETNVGVHIDNPYTWTAETPNLYELEIHLNSGTGTCIQTIHHDVGFRKVELKGGLMTVNGTPILLRGTNRHEHHPLHGRAVPLEFIRKDLILMKQYNINAIRTSHYPSHPLLYQMADELGFWVIDEADLECHGFWEAVSRPLNLPADMDYSERKTLISAQAAKFTSDNDSWREAYLDRMIQLVQRDKNHPSIIVWSLGNEAFYGKNHKAMYEYAKAEDPTRLVHYEGDVHAKSADMFSYMYPSVEKLLSLAETEAVEHDGSFSKPIILCEYAHAMGLGPGWLEQYQKAFRDVPRLQGGFIWEWANHGLLKTEGEKKLYAYGGDFGDVPNDGTFVMDGLLFSDHSPGPGLVELKKVIAPVRAWIEDEFVVVENGYDFASLAHLSASYKVESFGETNQIIESGHLDIPEIKPGHGRGKIQLPPSALCIDTEDECFITISFSLEVDTAWASAGHEVAWHQHRLSTTTRPKTTTPPAPTSKGLTLETSKLTYKIKGPNFTMTFNRTTGHLTTWETSSGLSLLGPTTPAEPSLHPTFWRAPIDNEIPNDTTIWKSFGLDTLTSQLRSFTPTLTTSTSITLVSHTYIAPPILAWGIHSTTTYYITSTGALHLKTNLLPTGSLPKTLPRIGVTLRLASTLSKATWFGLGPGQSYPDFKSAQATGIFSAPVDTLGVPYEVPQESGNHMETRWATFTSAAGVGLKATCTHTTTTTTTAQTTDTAPTFHFQASNYTAETVEEARHPCDLKGKEEDAIVLRLDVASAGVGTGACGPGVGQEWVVECRREGGWEFEFLLEVVGG